MTDPKVPEALPTSKVSAYAARARGGPLAPMTYTIDRLEPDDVVIAITHCGVCHSDVHLIDDDWGLSGWPLVPGHEIVGEIVAAGGSVKHLRPGDRVGVGWQRGSCHHCECCMTGRDNLCAGSVATCVGHHGGFATAIRLSSHYAFRLPDSLPSAGAAPLLCGGITVYGAMRAAALMPHMRIGVIGIGGLGHLALKFGRAMGCEVTAFSSTPDKADECRRLGAHHFVGKGETLEAWRGRFDLIISTVYADLEWRAYVECLRPDGRLTFVGIPGKPVEMPVVSLLDGRRSLSASPIGARGTIAEMLEFAGRHGIVAETEPMPLARVNDAVARVRSGKARYRVVLDCRQPGD